MNQPTRKRLHLWAAIFFACQIPLAIGLFVVNRKLFNEVSILYLCIVSIYALVATHLAGISAEEPEEQEDV